MNTSIKKINSCPLCKSPSCEIIHELPNQNVLECSDCHFVYADSILSSVRELYENGYFDNSQEEFGYQDYEKNYKAHEVTFRKRLQRAERYLNRKGLVLDCGCAFGHFSDVAIKEGWKVVATDISLNAVKHAKDNYNITGVVSNATSIPFKENTFDLIVLYDVLEHTDDPLLLLSNLNRLLKPNGIIHITTPNQKSLSARLMGKRWYHYKPLEHITYFSKKSLKDSLEKTGWSTLGHKTVIAFMALDTIMSRLKVYSHSLFSLIDKLLRAFKIDRVVIPLFIGEMEVWATKVEELPRNETSFPEISKVEAQEISYSSIVEYLKCPKCEGHLKIKNESKIECQNCQSLYDREEKIPVFDISA